MDRILLGHGSGGRLMHELIRAHFAPAFDIKRFADSALVDVSSKRIALTTDSYVVSPIFFPGGNIGELSVYGTVNDLSVSGAMPLFITAGFIIEEGFPLKDLKTIISSMAKAAKRAGVKVVAGDTKVVNKGKADRIFINTSGIGVLISSRGTLSPSMMERGDRVIISGEIGNHGIAVLAESNGLTFDPPVISDTAPLNGLVELMLKKSKKIRFMRDPTRGGLATTLKEAAEESGKCISITEEAVPVLPQVRGACELLGIDPLYVANEGILVAIAGKSDAGPLVDAMRLHPDGVNSKIIGTIEDSPSGMVLLKTSLGGTRIIDMLHGEQLPRIC